MFVSTLTQPRQGKVACKPKSKKITGRAEGTAPAGAFVINEEREPSFDHYLSQRARLKADPKSYQITGNADNIDERDVEDPLCCTEYVADMYTHFREKEASTSVRPTFMESQSYINERMRSILVDWLVQVHWKFKLVPETLYLTINLVDRYLEREEVTRPKLQLVGVTSLLIASKYEEIYPPELRDLVYICDRAYTHQDVSARWQSACVVLCALLCARSFSSFTYMFCLSSFQIIEMEEKILKTLEYQIMIPTARTFLVRYLKAGHADKKIVQLSCYIMDGTLQSYNLLRYLPSQLAAAAVFISRRFVGRNGWSPTLLNYSDYCEEEIIPVARAVLHTKNAAHPELKAVNKKYSSTRNGAVASTTLAVDF